MFSYFYELIKRSYINFLYNWKVTGTSRTRSRDLFTKFWDRRRNLLSIWSLARRGTVESGQKGDRGVRPEGGQGSPARRRGTGESGQKGDRRVRPEDSDRINTKLGLKFRKLYLYLEN